MMVFQGTIEAHLDTLTSVALFHDSVGGAFGDCFLRPTVLFALSILLKSLDCDDAKATLCFGNLTKH